MIKKKLTLILLPFVVIGLMVVYKDSRESEAYEISRINVTYDGDSPPEAMFSVLNMLPGDEIVKDFVVKNIGHKTVDVEMFSSLTDVDKDFDEILEIEITRFPSTLIFAGIMENFLSHPPFDLGSFAPNEEKTYRVKVKFPSFAGNEYQNAKIVFKLKWLVKYAPIHTPKPSPTPRPHPWWNWWRWWNHH
jgi:hypothetical protein